MKKFDVMEMKIVFDCKKKDENIIFFLEVNYPKFIEKQ